MVAKAKSTPIYSNWSMLDANGELLCRCGDKRAAWYLKRGLADLIDVRTIKLRFEADGPGDAGDLAMLANKQNKCVVCGVEEELNRHHIVPYQYRRHMPLELKKSNSYDVLPICLDHHEEYELASAKYSLELRERYNVPQRVANQLKYERRVVGAANAVYNADTFNIPAERLVELKAVLREHLGTDVVTYELLEELKADGRQKTGNPEAEHIVSVIMETDTVHEFIQGWRAHFIEVMKPQHMPAYWTVDHHRPRDLKKASQ